MQQQGGTSEVYDVSACVCYDNVHTVACGLSTEWVAVREVGANSPLWSRQPIRRSRWSRLSGKPFQWNHCAGKMQSVEGR